MYPVQPTLDAASRAIGIILPRAWAVLISRLMMGGHGHSFGGVNYEKKLSLQPSFILNAGSILPTRTYLHPQFFRLRHQTVVLTNIACFIGAPIDHPDNFSANVVVSILECAQCVDRSGVERI